MGAWLRLALHRRAAPDRAIVSAQTHTDGLASSADGGRYAPFVASALVASRFLPIWLATGVLAIVAAIIAPDALGSTSWAFVLPYMTILAVAALGQMLVVMHAGIDLSTPGVMSLGANLIVGVGAGSNGRLPVAILVCVAVGALVGLVNGVFVGLFRLNPLIVTLAVGQIVSAYALKYSRGLASATSTWVAAVALTLLTQMLRILGLSTAMQFVVFGAAILVGMLVSGDRVAALLGRVLRPAETPARATLGANRTGAT